MRVLGDISRLGAKRFGARTAISMSGSQLSYRSLDAMADRVAQGLCDHGVHQGDRVAVFAANNLAYPVVAIGALKCGAILLPLNFRYQAQELAYVLGDASPVVLFVEGGLMELVKTALADVACSVHLVQIPGATETDDWSWLDFASDTVVDGVPLVDRDIDPKTAAALMYTSGTTGKPKGVLFSHASYFATFHALIVEGDIQPGEVTLVNLPLFHQAGLFAMILPTWMRGGTVVLGSGSFDPAQVLRMVQDKRVTLTMWVPTMLARLLETPEIDRYDLSSLRKIYYGSAPMSRPLYAQATAAFAARFYQWYGLTETGLNAILRPEDHHTHAHCTGREVYNCELRIVDVGRDVEVGKVGEIHVSNTTHGMIGYWNNPEATTETIQNGWIKTGDLARREENNLFTIVDRSKDMIISGAENIYPKEIEDVLRAHPAVADVAVFGVPDDVYGEAVCAVIVLNSGHEPSPEEIIKFCADHLASYKKPKHVVYHADLPRNPMGKVTKGVLRAPFWQGRNRQI